MTNRANHRRMLALALLTVGLHVLVLMVIVPRIDAAGDVAMAPPRVTEAILIAAAVAPVDPPAPAPPPVLRPPPAVPAIAPVTFDIAAPPTPPPSAAIAAPLAPAAIDGGAAARPSGVESMQAASSTPPPAVAPPLPAPIVGKAYRTEVPPSARILLDVARKDADGTVWHGEAAMNWRLDNGRYRLKLEAGIRVLVTRVNLVVLESAGQVDAAGFVPRTMTEKRRGRAATSTQFDAEGNKMTFSASPASYAIVPGTQDKATVPLQLAAIARGDSAQLQGNIDMLVGEDKDASVFRFVLVGQTEIDTPIGRLATWHMSRPPRPGFYNSQLDIWLAPSLGWLPVRIDNIESSGATTTQTVKNIGRPDAG
ncbi:MAG: hypothetical protein JWP59_1499 [Massilia sp.]|nr:hypothetical protein [Massilia sp.]